MSQEKPRIRSCLPRLETARSICSKCIVMNTLNPIEELYDLYSEKEKTPWIMEVVDDGLDFDLDNENRPADLYLKL